MAERLWCGQRPYWTPELVTAELRKHVESTGRAPTFREWQRAKPPGAERPSARTVMDIFGSWGAGLESAGITAETPQTSLARRLDGACGRGHPAHEQLSGGCRICRAEQRRELGQRERMLTEEVDRRTTEAVALVRAGMSARAAAEATGIARTSLLRRLRRDHVNVPRAGKPISGLEQRVAAALDAIGIAYARQVTVRRGNQRFVLDFVTSDGVALEVNGAYWHADPRAFPLGPERSAQVRGQRAWRNKLVALASLRMPLAVAWEIDLDEDLEGTLRRVLRRLALGLRCPMGQGAPLP